MDLKTELINVLEQMLKPFTNSLAEDEQYISKYDNKAMELEKFSRSLFGYGPLLYNKPNDEVLRRILCWISDGVNPDSDKFWEVPAKMDQRHVEMFSVLFFLYNLREQIGKEYFEKNRDNLLRWFDNINYVKLPRNNWQFFGLLVNILLYKLGYKKIDWKQIRQYQTDIDNLYVSEGIYRDGLESQIDYYNSYAFHFYSLIYVKLMNEEDEYICKVYVERYKLFAKSFLALFSSKGDCVPYGRSLLYRFGVCASFSAAIYAEIETEINDDIAFVLLKNIKWWMNKDIFDTNGYLNLGYTYRNHKILEDYSSYGSPYWAFKFFIGLYSVQSSQFDYQKHKKDFDDIKISHDKFIIQSSYGNRYYYPVISSAGISTSINHYNNKYLKFCYTNLFGFNVDGDSCKINDVALDSSLSILDGDIEFHNKLDVHSTVISDNMYKSEYIIGNNYRVSSTVICLSPWHIRIHVINSPVNAIFREGGFPIDTSAGFKEKKEGRMIIINNKGQYSAIRSLYGNPVFSNMNLAPNTNVLYRKTAMPVAQSVLKKGINVIINGFYGDINNEKILSRFQIKFKNNQLTLYVDSDEFNLNIGENRKRNSNFLMRTVVKAKNIYKYIRENNL